MLHCMPTLLAGRMKSSLGACLRGTVIRFRTYLGAALPTLLLAAIVYHHSLVHPNSFVLFLLSCAFAYVAFATRKMTLPFVWIPVGDTKVAIFLEYQQLYSECSSVFFGDNGQGDLWCAEHLSPECDSRNPGDWEIPFPGIQGPRLGLQEANRANSQHKAGDTCSLSMRTAYEARAAGFTAAFIHEVVPRDEQLTSLHPFMSADAKHAAWKDGGIYFHRTYVGAAINAYGCDLISLTGLSRVCKSAAEDLVRMRIAFADSSQFPWNQLVDELNTDIKRANVLLPEQWQLDLVPEAIGISSPTNALKVSMSMSDFSFVTAPARCSISSE